METLTIQDMGKSKASRGSDDKSTDDAAERKRVVRSNRWDPELLDAIADYIGDQEVPPSEIGVMETAVKSWLRARKYWPRKAGRTSGQK